jgi:heme oxygenase (biliverdin-IX-beta and delta-forming)
MQLVDTPSLLAQLKATTRAQHERIGENPYAAAIVAGRLTGAQYARLLGRFYGFYQPAEQVFDRLDAWGSLGLDAAARRKAPLLVRDLAAFGCTVGALPRCDNLPDLSSPAQALGCMYVLEGSTLGGQLLARQIQQCLGLSPDHGCAFFACYREQTGPMWKAFGGALEGFAARAGQQELVVAAARETFTRLDAWLREAPCAG